MKIRADDAYYLSHLRAPFMSVRDKIQRLSLGQPIQIDNASPRKRAVPGIARESQTPLHELHSTNKGKKNK
jgi:hypothetical protein